jgi:lipopolysaccharide export system protein LptA
VVFEETAPSREGPVLGRAELIRYDNVTRTVELVGQVGLTVGPYDTTGCDLIYYLDEEDFTTGTEECDEPFTVIITPSEEQASETRVDSAP